MNLYPESIIECMDDPACCFFSWAADQSYSEGAHSLPGSRREDGAWDRHRVALGRGRVGAWQGSRGPSGTLVEDSEFLFLPKDLSCISLSLKAVVPKVSVPSVRPPYRNRSSLCRLDFSSPGYTLVVGHLTAPVFDLVMPSVLMTWQRPRSPSSDHSLSVAFLVVSSFLTLKRLSVSWLYRVASG